MSEVRTQQLLNWVHVLSLSTRVVAEGNAPQDSESAFWIRLHELLVSGPIAFKVLKDIAHHDPHPAELSLIKRGVLVHDAIAELRGRFSEDQLIYIDYMRNTHAHIYQGGYQVQLIKKKGTAIGLKDRREIKLIGKSFDIEALRGAIYRVHSTNNTDESALAEEFARIALPALKVISERLNYYHRGISRGF